MKVKPYFKSFTREIQLLFILVFFSFSLLILRAKISQSIFLFFLVWNLFLAFVPYVISSFLKHSIYWQEKKYIRLLLFAIWLLFLPNAFYILTDFVHLLKSTNIPFWYDLMVISSFALTGFFVGILTVNQMQQLVQVHYSTFISHLFVIIILYLSGLGVYLGRYLRFNSWDIFHDPIPLFQSIWEALFLSETLQFSFGFGTFTLLLYQIFLFIPTLSNRINS